MTTTEIKWQPLSENTIQAIMRMNDTGINKVGMNSMAPMCFNLGKKVGDVVHMLARPTGGIAPYTASFKKGVDTGATLLKQVTNLSEGQMVPYDYILTDVDANLTQTFSTVIVDSCSSGAKQCVESCDITVAEAVPTPVVCGIPACNLVVT